MPTEKIVKARKDHKCDHCDGIIQKGEKYLYMEMKNPKYADSDYDEYEGEQIGVTFDKYRLHDIYPPCHWPDQCKQGNHEIIHYHESDPESENCGEDFYFCHYCNSSEEEIKKLEQCNTPTT